ncbi:hypothetical protein NLI96_g3262 [Meripilus lineatus]|uniref:Uncharacterized protein n=1 Tax=Meripilus lineatus TaxID=2056292 RepID=A0AAD5YL67_9APHY|nr:hypothetical protein NLI96_g3262 [Physisporinus lineatus]
MASLGSSGLPPFCRMPAVDLSDDDVFEEQLAAYTERFRQHPEMIAGVLKRVHEDPPGLARHFFSQVFENLLRGEGDQGEVPDLTLHIMCTTGMVDVLLDIALDARIYMWHKLKTSFYYPWLGRYVIAIYEMLNKCCSWLICEVDTGRYEDIMLHQLPKARKLWALLWINRQLLDDEPENSFTCPRTGETSGPDYFRDMVVLSIWHMVSIHTGTMMERKHPTWAVGADELLFYCWQYLPHGSPICYQVVTLLAARFLSISEEESKRIITKAIIHEQMALRILFAMCHGLEREHPSTVYVLDLLTCLRVSLTSSFMVSEVAAKNANIFRAVASALQYLLCATQNVKFGMSSVQEGFQAVT